MSTDTNRAELVRITPALPNIPGNTVSIKDFGAMPGGVDDNTAVFAAAIDACAAKGGGTVVVPSGLWLTGPIVLRSKINLHLEKGALVVFSPNCDDYPMVETFYEGIQQVRKQSPISGRDLEDVAITGEGVFEGSGQAWWRYHKRWVAPVVWEQCTEFGGVIDKTGERWAPSERSLNGAEVVERLRSSGVAKPEDYAVAGEYLRPVLVSLINCRRVLLEGVTFTNSPAWCLHPIFCEDLTVRHITVCNPEKAPNGDGIDIDSCRRVWVTDSTFDCGDDCICIKSGKDEEGRARNRPCEDVLIERCLSLRGHGGVTIGSEMSGGVRNIFVDNCTFVGTDIGIRLKSRRGRGGIVENVDMRRIRMAAIAGPAITIDMAYASRIDLATAPPEPVNDGTPIFRNIRMQDIVCRGARTAGTFHGLPEMPIQNVSIEDAVLVANKGISQVHCDLRLTNVKVETNV